MIKQKAIPPAEMIGNKQDGFLPVEIRFIKFNLIKMVLYYPANIFAEKKGDKYVSFRPYHAMAR